MPIAGATTDTRARGSPDTRPHDTTSATAGNRGTPFGQINGMHAPHTFIRPELPPHTEQSTTKPLIIC